MVATTVSLSLGAIPSRASGMSVPSIRVKRNEVNASSGSSLNVSRSDPGGATRCAPAAGVDNTRWPCAHATRGVATSAENAPTTSTSVSWRRTKLRRAAVCIVYVVAKSPGLHGEKRRCILLSIKYIRDCAGAHGFREGAMPRAPFYTASYQRHELSRWKVRLRTKPGHNWSRSPWHVLAFAINWRGINTLEL